MAGYGLVVDVGRCSGCMTCVVACKHENLTEPGVCWNRVLEVKSAALNQIAYFRYGCMHCDNPACAQACPEHAIYKRPDGIVLINYEKCKGHRECVKACPYKVIDINSGKAYFDKRLSFEKVRDDYRSHPPGKPSFCTLCVHRIERGKEPACVEACPAKALIFVNLEDPESLSGKRVRESGALFSLESSNHRVFYIIPEGMSKLMGYKQLETLQTGNFPNWKLLLFHPDFPDGY